MGIEAFDDDLVWPTRKGRAPARYTTPPIASTLELPAEAIERGAWHDDFLILGSRLRPMWGDELWIDEEVPAYVVPYREDYDIRVTCPLGRERPEFVRSSCDILQVSSVDKGGIFEFALRENAELPLAHLSFVGDRLVAEHKLPFVAAGVPALGAAVEAVGWAACRLRRELTAAFRHAAR